MRHRVKTNHIGRFSSLRKATINSIVRSIILHQSIETTYAKAKAAVPKIEQLITLAKEDTLLARRRVYRVLLNHRLVNRLFSEVGELFKNRSSGFTRVFRIARRRGDGAQMVVLELTEKTIKEKKPKKEKEKEELPEVKEKKPGAIDEKQITPEEKPPVVKKERPRVAEKKKEPTKGFLGGLRRFFKKERDSL